MDAALRMNLKFDGLNELPRRKRRGITRNMDRGRRKRRETFGPSLPSQKPGQDHFF
jgi:hypothetical protein